MQCEKILLPVVVPSETRGNIELAVRLLPAHGKLVALKVIRVPEATSLSEGAAEAVVRVGGRNNYRERRRGKCRLIDLALERQRELRCRPVRPYH